MPDENQPGAMLTLVVSMRNAKVVPTANSVLPRKENAAVYLMAKQAWPWHPAKEEPWSERMPLMRCGDSVW